MKLRKDAMAKLDTLILATPTGLHRNRLTSINMVMQAIDNDMNPRHLEDMVKAMFGAEPELDDDYCDLHQDSYDNCSCRD